MFWNRNKNAASGDLSSADQISNLRLPTDQRGRVEVEDKELQVQIRYHGLRNETLNLLVAATPHITPILPSIVHALLEKVRSRPAIWSQVEKLPEMRNIDSEAVKYLTGVLTGPLDKASVLRARKIGESLATHSIDPMWVTGLTGYLQKLCLDGLKAANICLEDQILYSEQLGNRLSFEASLILDGHGHALRNQAAHEVQDFEKKRDDFIANLCKTIREAAAKGDLTSRSDLHNFPVEYRDLVGSLNELLDSILVPVGEAIEVLQQVRKRDLTHRIEGDYAGDHRLMPTALNPALDHLNEALSKVVDSIVEVESGAAKLADTSGSLSAGATEQASSLEEIRSTVDSVTAQTRSNAEGATRASELADAARLNADKGSGQMSKMLEAMTAIEESSGQISRIIKVIEEIAFQTNLLSLNAAVEAARAGVHGKGFAVVADEVRNLAQRSAKAAKETNDLIKGTIDRVKHGAEIATSTSDALGQIVETVSEVSRVIRDIATASIEQTQGIEQVNEALGQIENVTQHTAANAEESASVSEQLSAEAGQLKQLISAFKIQSVSRKSQPARIEDSPRRPQRHLPSPSPTPSPTNGKKKQASIGSLDDVEFEGF